MDRSSRQKTSVKPAKASHPEAASRQRLDFHMLASIYSIVR